MKTTRSVRRITLSACLSVILLAACGTEDPQAMLASAREYLAKNDANAALIQIKNALQKTPDSAEGRFLLGKVLLETGNPAAAEVELRKATSLKHSPDEVAPMLLQALLEAGQAKKVIEEAGKLVVTRPASKAGIQTSLAAAHITLGDGKAADAAIAAALAEQPDYAPALLVSARIKAGRRDFAAALIDVDKAIAGDATNRMAWILKGDILRVQGQPEPALAAYRKVLELRPDVVVAHAGIVSLLMAEGRFDDAAKQIEAMKKVTPKHPQIYFLDGQLAIQKKDFDRAREIFQQLLAIVPENPAALQMAGIVDYSRKSYAQAEAYLTKALKISPELGLARRFLIGTYLRTGQPQKALATLQPVLDKIDKDPYMLALAGEVYVQSGEIEKAEAYFVKATTASPNTTAMRTALAMTRLMKGDVETAYDQLSQISATDSGITADMALISSHLRRKEFDKALKAIAVLEKKQPNEPSTHHLRGNALLAKKDVAGARNSFEQALKLKPGYFPAAASLAGLDLADKKPEAARKRFEQVLAVDPKNVQSLMALAEMAARSGSPHEEVATLINKAVTADPTAVGPRLALVETYLRAKDVKKALAAAQDAAAAIPDRPEILDMLGRTQQLAGESNQALTSYGKLAAMRNDSPIPHLRMAEIHAAAKNFGAAEQSLRKALEVRPGFLDAQRQLINLLVGRESFAQAIEVARDIQKAQPKEAVGYLFEGDIHLVRKAVPEAIAIYREGLKRAPAPELATKLHSTLTFSGNKAEADRFQASWTKEHPNDLVFRFHLGDLALSRKDYTGAALQFKAILDKNPNNPLVLNNLAWVSGQLKDPKALEYAEKANQLAPNQPPFMDTLAVLLAERGDTARALQLLRKALELAPDAHLIRLSLAKVEIKGGEKSAAKKDLETLAKLGEKFPANAEVSRLLKEL